MLSKADNEFLTRAGKGTPMGEMLRRFWMPALLSKELPERDGPPKKIRLLGEDLLAFRQTDGRVGIVEPHCPHRGANLYYGRNENCGLRCSFHGWKFDVDGNCVDLPTSPPESAYKDTIKLLAYPTREWDDMVWAYMGPRETMPELPQLELGLVPAASRFVTKKWQDCNWVQSLEGAIDTSHFSFLHKVLATDDEAARRAMSRAALADQAKPDDRVRWVQNDPRPRFSVLGHDTGLVIAGGRKTDGHDLYWRIAQFLMPNHAYTPAAFPGEIYYGQSWVPVDDVNCWIYTYCWQPDRPLSNSVRAQVPRRLQRTFRSRRGLQAAAQQGQRLSARAQRATQREFHRNHRRFRAGRRDPGQPGADPGPHEGTSRADRHRHRRVPQAGDGNGPAPRHG
jgi:phenylpropionate dioxygenase-like ring-hydroxylating dioxygenase large terminal subunit